ncbi:MAG: hypothetical protein JW791_05485 [Nanoarchaeota archaeon]|nr:hypothetical protein [Nanoarchaeota archaeon]
MNKKSQVQAVREIFQFGLGLFMLVTIIYMFYNNFIPTVADYALTIEADNINSHVNYLVTELLEVVNSEITSGSFELTYEMPRTIGEYSYTTFFTATELCTTIDGLRINQCTETSYSNIYTEGVYISGGELKIEVIKTNEATQLYMSN